MRRPTPPSTRQTGSSMEEDAWQLSSLGRPAAHRTVATLGLAAIVVAGCAAPGAGRDAAADGRARDGRTATAAPGESTAPSASSEASVPDCGTDPVTLNIYHETISELMPQLSAEFTKQYPNVTFELKSDAFANATANLPRLLVERQPARHLAGGAADRPREGRPAPEPRSLRDGVRLGCVAAGPVRGRSRQQRLQARDGPDHRLAGAAQHGRRLLQQGPGRADRHDRAAEDRRGVRRAPGQGQGGRAPADHGVERLDERRRPRVPAPEPDGRLRRPLRDQRLGVPQGGRHDRDPGVPPGDPEARRVDQERVLPRGRQRDRVLRRRRALRQGRGRLHLQRRLAERRLRHGPAGQGRLLHLPRGRRASPPA